MAQRETTSKQVTDRARRQEELQHQKVLRIKEQIKKVRKSALDEYEVAYPETGETKVMTRAEVLAELEARFLDARRWRTHFRKKPRHDVCDP